MTETIPLIFDYAFNSIGLHRIEGFVETENVSCKRGLAKLKFNLEGTMQDCEIENGKFISLDIYSKIAISKNVLKQSIGLKPKFK